MINLTKGGNVNLTKDNPGLDTVRVGLSWAPAGTKTAETKTEGGGFLKTIGKALTGEISWGKAVDNLTGEVQHERPTTGRDIDIDLSVYSLENGKYYGKDNLVCFFNRNDNARSIIHHGDSLTGRDVKGNDSTEEIDITLSKVPTGRDRLVVVANIFGCESKRQDFGMIVGACIHIKDLATGKELCQYNLTDDYSGKTAVEVGELYRHDGGWKFRALGNGSKDRSLEEMTRRYK